MKTTKILGILAFLSALMISSCNQNPLDMGNKTIDPHFFTNIMQVKDLKVIANEGNGYTLGTTARTSLLLLLSGDSYSQLNSATSDEFKKLANKIGDTASEEGYSHVTKVDYHTTDSSIADMTVKALSQYDESHPQGSSLKDIIQINYQSFDHVFNKTLKPTTFGDVCHAMYSIDPSQKLSPVKYPAIIAGTFAGTTRFNDGLVMSIEFLQAPSTPQQQLQVTILFENGKELKKDITVDILEIEK